MPPTIRDHGNRSMLWPNVLGQSGTASAAPVLVTRPPRRMSTPVAASVMSARGYATRSPPRSVPSRAGGDHRRRRLRKEVFAGVGRAVLVGTPMDRGQARAPV